MTSAYKKFNWVIATWAAMTAMSGCDKAKIERSKRGPLVETTLAENVEPRFLRPGTEIHIRGVEVDNNLSAELGGVKLPLRYDQEGVASAVVPAGGGTGKVSLVLRKYENIQSVGLFFDGTAGDLPIITEVPSEVCAPKKYYDSNGQVQIGTRVCDGAASVATPDPKVTTKACVTWDLSKQFPSGECVNDIKNPPTSEVICNASTGGLPFVGLNGSAVCATSDEISDAVAKATASTMLRGLSPQLNLVAERQLPDAAATQIAGYYEVPRIAVSTEQPRNPLLRLQEDLWETGIARLACGTSGTIAARIANCDAVHAAPKPSWDDNSSDDALSWNGAKKGAQAEGSWTLVSIGGVGLAPGTVCTAACREVWRDDRTGLIWSDRLGGDSGSQTNWCQAVGHGHPTTPAGNPFGEADPSNICDDPVNQPEGLPISWCVESVQWLSTESLAANGKNGLDADTVRWRVPTLADWRQAELNGLRAVLPNLQHTFWTATIRSAAPSQAWQYDGRTGVASPSNRASMFGNVRCVGR